MRQHRAPARDSKKSGSPRRPCEEKRLRWRNNGRNSAVRGRRSAASLPDVQRLGRHRISPPHTDLAYGLPAFFPKTSLFDAVSAYLHVAPEPAVVSGRVEKEAAARFARAFANMFDVARC
jgi:hypothetical protein